MKHTQNKHKKKKKCHSIEMCEMAFNTTAHWLRLPFCFHQRQQPRESELRSHAAPNAVLGVPQPCGCNLAGVTLPSVDGVYTPPDLSSQTAGPEKLTGLIYDAGLRRRRQRSENRVGERRRRRRMRLVARVQIACTLSIFLRKSKWGRFDRISLGRSCGNPTLFALVATDGWRRKGQTTN